MPSWWILSAALPLQGIYTGEAHDHRGVCYENAIDIEVERIWMTSDL